jgi:hypothetical protein
MCPYRDCVPPVDHELNLTTQAILTYGSWALTAVILGLAIRMGIRERTPFYALMVLAAMVGAFAEPRRRELLAASQPDNHPRSFAYGRPNVH